MLFSSIRRAGTALALTLGIAATATIGLAPVASANPLQPAQTECGWTTCTVYWSVNGTKDLNSTWKDGVVFAYAVPGSALAFAGPPGLAGATIVGYKAAEFAVQVSTAATEGRCLIYKHPKGLMANGWWGSVSSDNNFCVQG